MKTAEHLKHFIFALVLLVAIILGYLWIRSYSVAKHPFFNLRKNDGVLVIAHRGGLGLMPENTLPAFNNAESLGADVVELDIHSSKDGHIVIMHDDDIDRTTDGSGKVSDFTLNELKQFDAGYRWTADEGKTFPFRGKGIQIPTLSEAITEIKNAGIIIEIKQDEPSLIKPLSEIIRNHNLQNRVIVASFSVKALVNFRTAMPEVATSTNKSEALIFYLLNKVYLAGFYRPNAVALQVPEHYMGKHIITRRFVSTAKKQNLEVHAWTINETEDMKRLIGLGVEGIVTDYPDRLLKLLGRSQ